MQFPYGLFSFRIDGLRVDPVNPARVTVRVHLLERPRLGQVVQARSGHGQPVRIRWTRDLRRQYGAGGARGWWNRRLRRCRQRRHRGSERPADDPVVGRPAAADGAAAAASASCCRRLWRLAGHRAPPGSADDPAGPEVSRVRRSSSAGSARVSTLSRITGSVFDMRRLKRQSGNSSPRPSVSSTLQGCGCVATAHTRHGRGGIRQPAIDLAADGIAGNALGHQSRTAAGRVADQAPPRAARGSCRCRSRRSRGSSGARSSRRRRRRPPARMRSLMKAWPVLLCTGTPPRARDDVDGVPDQARVVDDPARRVPRPAWPAASRPTM